MTSIITDNCVLTQNARSF